MKNCNGINYFYPESQFAKAATISNNWPNIPEPDKWGHGHITREIQLIESNGYSSIDKFIDLTITAEAPYSMALTAPSYL